MNFYKVYLYVEMKNDQIQIYNTKLINKIQLKVNNLKMGNQNLTSSNINDKKKQISPQKNQLQVLYECEQGQVAQSLNSGNQYFIRQLSFGNLQSMQKTLDQLQLYKQKNPQMLINLLQIENICIKTMCGTQYKLRLIFQYSALSINDEIQARKKTNKNLDYIDCCRVIIGCVQALAQIEKQVQLFSFLVKNGVYNRVFPHPERILLMNSGVIKLTSPLIVSPYDRLQHKNNCYYSPQKLADFDYNQDQKCALFQLGITLIHVLILNSCKDIYNGFQVKQQEIDKKISNIWQLYSDSLVCQILSKITRNKRSQRANMQQIMFLVKKLQQKLAFFLKQFQPEQLLLMQNQQFSGLQLSRQSISSRSQTVAKQNIMRNSNRQNTASLKYSTSFSKSLQPQGSFESSNKKQRKRKHKLQLFTNYHQSNIIQTQSNKKQVILNLTQNVNLPYSVTTNKNSNKSLNLNNLIDNTENKQKQIEKTNNILKSTNETEYDTYGNINNKLFSSKKQVKKNQQSCVVTNQQPFYNMVTISHDSFSQHTGNKNEMQNSIFEEGLIAFRNNSNTNKMSNKQNKRNGTGKQSYLYGNQLSEGIILKQNLKNKYLNKTNDFLDLNRGQKMDIELNKHVYTGGQQDQQMIQQRNESLKEQMLSLIQNCEIQSQSKNNTTKFEWKRTQFSKKNRKSISSNYQSQRQKWSQALGQNYVQTYRQAFHRTYNLQQINQLMKTNKNENKQNQMNHYGGKSARNANNQRCISKFSEMM